MVIFKVWMREGKREQREDKMNFIGSDRDTEREREREGERERVNSSWVRRNPKSVLRRSPALPRGLSMKAFQE